MTRKLVSLFLSLALLCAFVPAMADGITVTDMAGREIALDAPADRIVVLMPADAEILYALGASESIVGIGSDCAAEPEAAVMPGIDQQPVMNPGTLYIRSAAFPMIQLARGGAAKRNRPKPKH